MREKNLRLSAYVISIGLIGFFLLPFFAGQFLGEEEDLSIGEAIFYNASGEPIPIHEHKGKVIVLDFWATWCGPCKAAFPEMQKLYDQFVENASVEFYFVNTLSKGDSKERAGSYISSKGFTFPIAYDHEDVNNRLGVTSIPHSIIIDTKGVIRYRHTGYFPGENLVRDFSKKIETYLKE